jgi:hypothetical protein
LGDGVPAILAAWATAIKIIEDHLPQKNSRRPLRHNSKSSCATLEKAGVEFIAENGGGAGVRLKKAKRKAK